MAYIKTRWVNDNTPAINEVNLNKIENELASNDQKNADNSVAIHNLRAGSGAAIKGTKALNDIYTTAGNVNDIYIDAATGNGWISDGQGAGASHWTMIGRLRGDQGAPGHRGDKGERGTGIHFEHVYADLAALKAANPNPDIGETHLTIDTGDLYVYDNPTPPHNPAGADWHDAGHVQGPPGPKGDPGHPGTKGDKGDQGEPGASVHLADGAETKAGTVTNKGVTPHNLSINMPTLAKELTVAQPFAAISLIAKGQAYIRGGDYAAGSGTAWFIGRNAADKDSVQFNNQKVHSSVKLSEDGTVNLYPASGKKATVGNKPIVTGSLSGTTLTLHI